VVMGCARDVVEFVGVPRFVFSDFPLGNAAGRPHDVASQDQTLELALRSLEQARAPRFTLVSPQRWGDHDDWKHDYANAERLSGAELARLRAEFDRSKALAQQIKQAQIRRSQPQP
jgi:D-proline reductase (dithiol) PrdB